MLKLLAPFQTCCFFKYAVSGMKVLLNMSEGLFLILRRLDMRMLTIDSEICNARLHSYVVFH
jgi:hypothetical protein